MQTARPYNNHMQLMAIIELKQLYVYKKLLNLLHLFGILFVTLIQSSLTSIDYLIAKSINNVC